LLLSPACIIIPGVVDIIEPGQSQATALCMACGLCCTGHLFNWVRLKPSELDPIEGLGVPVMRSDPTERGFSLPCPLWNGACSIHDSPAYPRACKAYRCKLLKAAAAGAEVLPAALETVARARAMIAELEAYLPRSPGRGFRERLVAHIEQPPAGGDTDPNYLEFRRKAGELLAFYAEHFGVTGLLEDGAEAGVIER